MAKTRLWSARHSWAGARAPAETSGPAEGWAKAHRPQRRVDSCKAPTLSPRSRRQSRGRPRPGSSRSRLASSGRTGPRRPSGRTRPRCRPHRPRRPQRPKSGPSSSGRRCWSSRCGDPAPRVEDRGRGGGPGTPCAPCRRPAWLGRGEDSGAGLPRPACRGEDSPPVRGHPCDVSRRCLAGSSCSRGGPAAVPESGGESSGGSGDEVVTKSDRASGVWLPCPPHARVHTHTHAHVHMHTRTRARTHRRTCQGRPSGSTLSETSFCR